MKRIHFVGIGGAGLSAIARLLLESGYSVSGSDQALSPFAEALKREGVMVSIGHAAENVRGADVVIVSSAVPSENVEVRAAREAGIPVLKRQDFLGELMAGKVGVAVAGTHGKTTTAGLIAFLLDRAGRDPSYIVGGALEDFGTNAHAGRGEVFVVEADEYDRMFLGLRPKLAVVTNVEHDHPDLFPTREAVQEAFREFVALLPADGTLVLCADDAGALSLQAGANERGTSVVTYGLNLGAPDWRAESIQVNGAGGSDFLVVRKAETLGLARTRLPGRHNVGNCLAALAAVDALGVEFNSARAALAEYRGAGRRFEVKGDAGGVTVIDDYAHHPTEIRATLAAARFRFGNRPLWAVFQPHTYSRTKALLTEFAGAFKDADHVLVTDVFASREQKDPAVSSAELVKMMHHPDARYTPSLDAAAETLLAELKSGDVLITLSAGDGNWVGGEVMRRRADSGRGGTAAGRGTRGGIRDGVRDGETVEDQGGDRGPRNDGAVDRGGEGALTVEAGRVRELFGEKVRIAEPLARYTSARIGGPADALLEATSAEELAEMARTLRAEHYKFIVLGGGSNVLVADAGYRGVVLLNHARAVTFDERGEDVVCIAESGASLGTVARQCVLRGFTGLEWAATVPGTVGGAVVGNAGAHGGDMAGNLTVVEILHGEGKREWMPAGALGYAYRTSRLKREPGWGIVLAARLALRRGSVDEAQAQVEEFVAHRRRTQPPGASIGSMFKNPPGDYAGRLIEAAGLKGARVGNAEISQAHANFFVNLGEARAADVRALIEKAREEVKRRFGVELELEVELVGEWG